MTRFVSREHLRGGAMTAICCAALSATPNLVAQVLTVDTHNPIESRYTDIKRTHVELSSQPLLQRTKLQLVRVLEAEQGFAMRPLPKGSKGMVLEANGAATPNGSDYAKTLQHNGTAIQAADRVSITDIKFVGDKIVFELNDGPDQKHRILRHISVGTGAVMVPLAKDNGQDPVGVRITLQFEKFVPEMTGTQVMELLAPLVDFKLKTPVQAYVDTLPPQLKQAILDHHVLVGMDPQMVLYALGHPDSKSRERDGDMPFEEWIYGQPPQDVQFVRFNGNRVIQVEEAKMGEPPIIRKTDEMGNYWQVVTANKDANIREISMGDTSNTERAHQESAVKAPPSLRKPGEALPNDDQIPQLGKVQLPPGLESGSKPAQGTTAPAGGGSGSGTTTGSGTGTAPPPPPPTPAPQQYVSGTF